MRMMNYIVIMTQKKKYIDDIKSLMSKYNKKKLDMLVVTETGPKTVQEIINIYDKKIYNTIEVIAESLICIFTFILIVWLLSLFDCLSGKQYEIILTFLGVIATFVVINNFRQAQESKELAKKEIEEYEKYIEEYEPADEIIPDVVDVSRKVREQLEFVKMYNDLAKENLI